MQGIDTNIDFRQVRVSPSYNDIIEQNDQNALIAIGDAIEYGYWKIADITNQYTRRTPVVTQQGQIITNQQVYEAVAHFVSRGSFSITPRTVRYYADVGRFYPQDVRDEFDLLPFAFFAMAQTFHERWQEVLEYARDHYPITVSEVRLRFLGHVPIESEVESTGLFDEASDALDAADAPPATLDERRKAVVLSGLSHAVNGLAKLMLIVAPDDGVRERIVALLEGLRDVIRELQERE